MSHYPCCEDAGNCRCIYPGQFCRTRRAAFLAEYKLRPSRRLFCLHKLIGRRCTYGADCWEGLLDHLEAFVDAAGKPAALVGQPYVLAVKDWEALAKIADRLGLVAEVRPDLSWHLPGQTTLFILRRKEVPVA